MASNGLVRNRIVLGLMTFGPDKSKGARITSVGEFNQILEYFKAQGYDEADTSSIYLDGEQEAFTAKSRYKEIGLKLATKAYPFTSTAGMPPQLQTFYEANKTMGLSGFVKKSLDNLGTDYVDTFYLHAPDRSRPFVETLAEVDRLYKEKKFGRLGLANFASFEVAECVMICKYHNFVRPTVYQGMYNAITRNVEAEMIPACRRYGMDYIAYNPLAAGFLSGRYSSAEYIPSEGRFSNEAMMGARLRARYFREPQFKALQIIEPAIQKAGLTMIETAIRWLVHHSLLNVTNGNDGIVLGVSSLQQLKENLANAEKGPLPVEVVKALDDAWEVAKVDQVTYWHLDLKYAYDTQRALFGP